MGQGQSRPMTHVANGYHEDILACVKANRIEVYEKQKALTAKLGGSVLPASGGLALNTHHKRQYVTHDPGFSTIKPGCYLGFAESGADGKVFVTIKIGSDIPNANFQVYNGCNVLVDKEGSLRNVKDEEIWTDISGETHLAETFTNMKLISSAEGLLKNQDAVETGPRTPERQTAEDSRLIEVLQRYRNKGQVKKYFGTLGKGTGQMDHPCGISSTTSGDIVVAESSNHRIQIFDVNGRVKGVFGSEGEAKEQFSYVTDVCVTSQGRIVASDMFNNRIQIFDEQGKFVRMFGSKGSGDGELKFPAGVATDDKGMIYVYDANRRVQVFSEDGKFARKFGLENQPHHLSVTPNGRLVVSDFKNHRVQVYDSYDGRHLFQFGTKGTNESEFNCPTGVATDQHGNIIVCDEYNHRVQVFTSGGEFVACFGSEGSDPGQMKRPIGVCILSDGGIAVCEFGNHRIQIF